MKNKIKVIGSIYYPGNKNTVVGFSDFLYRNLASKTHNGNFYYWGYK